MKKSTGVQIKVHDGFFNNIFERERIKVQNTLGLKNLSQGKFTHLMHKLNAKLVYPSLSKSSLKISKKYGGLDLGLGI